MSIQPTFRHIASVVIMPSLSGCAVTNITSQVNPVYANQSFEKVMVHANFSDLGYKQAAEARLCEKIQQGTPTECVRAGDLFFPGQEYTDKERRELIISNNIDAMLLLSSTNAGTNTTQVPVTGSTTTTSGSVYGNTYSGQSNTQYHGGQTYHKPWASFETSLIAVPSGDSVWYASATSSGNAYADAHDLVNSVTSKVYSRLLDDGIISPLTAE